MVVKFRTSRNESGIKAYEVLRETGTSVFVMDQYSKKERREGKLTTWTQYHDTWEQAKDYLLKEATARVISARRSLELANARIGNIKGLKPPKPEPSADSPQMRGA